MARGDFLRRNCATVKTISNRLNIVYPILIDDRVVANNLEGKISPGNIYCVVDHIGLVFLFYFFLYGVIIPLLQLFMIA